MNKAVINNALNEVDHITEYMIDRTKEFEIIDWLYLRLASYLWVCSSECTSTRVLKSLIQPAGVVYLSSLVYIMWQYSSRMKTRAFN
jgi:hypothetical protein